MAIHYARVHGPVLAALMQSAAASNRVCDGLLFGQTRVVTREQMHDDAEAHTVEELVADITGSLCCCSTCSFYDAAGQVDGAKLEDITRGAPGALLGWFSCRPAAALQPSMREAAVTASLQRWLRTHQGDGAAEQGAGASASSSSGWGASGAQGGPPLLFALLAPGQDHGGATTTLQLRLMQPPGSGSTASASAPASSGRHAQVPMPAGPLVGVPLRTLNLGRSLGQQHHHAQAGSAASAEGSAQQHQQVDGSGLGAALQHAAHGKGEPLAAQLRVVADAAAEQVAGLQGACEVLLARVEVAAERAGGQQLELATLRGRADGLLLELQQRLESAVALG